MHFGSARVSLTSGEVVFVDEDHRDGDFDVGRIVLDAGALERVRVALNAR